MKLKQILNEVLNERFKIDVNFVVKTLNSCKKKLIGDDLGNLEIEKILNRAFLGKGIYFNRNPSFGEHVRDDFAQVGLVRGYIDENGAATIEYDDNFWKTFEDDYSWNDFIHACKLIISHELTHRYQIGQAKRKSGFVKPVDMKSNSTYLSDKREIMAFAQEAVKDFLGKGYKKSQIIQLLRTPRGSDYDQSSKEESNPFWYYYEYFYNDDKEVWNRFTKYMFQFLEKE